MSTYLLRFNTEDSHIQALAEALTNDPMVTEVHLGAVKDSVTPMDLAEEIVELRSRIAEVGNLTMPSLQEPSYLVFSDGWISAIGAVKNILYGRLTGNTGCNDGGSSSAASGPTGFADKFIGNLPPRGWKSNGQPKKS